MREDNARRLAIYFVDWRMLLGGLELGKQLRAKVGSAAPFLLAVEELDIPDGARIVSVHIDEPRHGLAVVLQSQSFEPVPRGRLIPHLGEGRMRVVAFHVLQEATLETTPPTPQWTPTVEAVNALPAGLRDYIHALETRADPAGDLRSRRVAEDAVVALEAEIEELRTKLAQLETEAHR